MSGNDDRTTSLRPIKESSFGEESPRGRRYRSETVGGKRNTPLSQSTTQPKSPSRTYPTERDRGLRLNSSGHYIRFQSGNPGRPGSLTDQ